MKNKLTVKQIEALKPESAPRKVFDGGGLFLYVTPGGSMLWRWKYRFHGKEKLASFGPWPEVSLKRARELRDEGRAKLRNGLDPSSRGLDPDSAFELVAREWHRSQHEAWSAKHSSQVLDSLERFVFRELGHRSISEIEPPDVLRCLRKIEAKGSYEVAKRTCQRVSAVFRYAIASGIATRDAAADVRGALRKRKPKNFAALDPAEFPALVKAVHNYRGDTVTRLGLELIMLTMVRTAEARCAFWSEFDIDQRLWVIPAERMKMGREHLVPLSGPVVELLEQLQGINGAHDRLFPHRTRPQEPMSYNTFLQAIYRMGYRGRMTVHGFRSIASTILNEQQVTVQGHAVPRFSPDWIERQLAHVPANEVRAAYNRAAYLEQRRDMLAWWADYCVRHRNE